MCRIVSFDLCSVKLASSSQNTRSGIFSVQFCITTNTINRFAHSPVSIQRQHYRLPFLSVSSHVIVGISETLFPGVPVNRLFRAAADLSRECERRVGERGVLRRLQELPWGSALCGGWVWHLLQGVPQGVSAGHHHWGDLHLWSQIYASSRWKYVELSERKEQNRRRWQDCHPVPIRMAGKSLI